MANEATAELPAEVEAVLDDIFFRPAHWHSAYEVAVQRLAQAIKLGALGVGARLPPERELVERLSVSRTTLREAIRALQEQGYLKSSRGRAGGTFVASRQLRQPTKADIQRLAAELGSTLTDLMDLREAAEPKAAELAAVRATDAEIRSLTWLLAQSKSAPTSELRQTDSTLHIAIAHAAHSDLLLDDVLEEQMRLHDLLAYLPIAPPLRLAARRSTHGHAHVVEAIADRDPEGAREAMDRHIRATHDLIRGLLPAASTSGKRTRSLSRTPTS
jgi:DNA-binding FadR family transcriptional regulator